MIGMAIFMRGLWAVSTLSRSEIEISGMERQEGRGEGYIYLISVRLWNFKNVGSSKARFLPKNQHGQRKI